MSCISKLAKASAHSANAHHGIDQQTLEARAYAVARRFSPMLVNSVVGFIGPEYLFDGKQIIRAGLEDHFCGKLMGADQPKKGARYAQGVLGGDLSIGKKSGSLESLCQARSAADRKRRRVFSRTQ
jgi:Ethanolamine ammonia lyase large subunit (EutB)